ncbi:MAG TPA: LapA family protein [Nocardioidaceae bacterium]|nr:LapA family protein [Nocardioidaceae bacterium]
MERPHDRWDRGLVLLVVWILVNRDTVEVSFVVWTAALPLWVALIIAAVLGVVVGYLMARKRHRR